MTLLAINRAAAKGADQLPARGRLFRKYIALFVAVVAVALVANGLIEIWFSYREQRTALVRMQHAQAEAAAAKISEFIREIEGQLGWMTQLPWSASSPEEWRFDAVRLLRQVPAITELVRLDGAGREQARMSRLAVDVIGSGSDFSQDPKFVQAIANKHYYGPVYFRRESEPYMTLAIAGARRDYGVVVAEVNLRFIWDVVSEMKVGERGIAYVVDADGRLIAHPDISLVLRNTDLSRLPQVRAARQAPAARENEEVANSVDGTPVLSAYAPVESLGWLLFVETPVAEAYAPLYISIERSGLFIVAALALAVMAGLFLARRMIVPIRALRDGAARIGSGDLSQRISIDTNDELEALGEQFNSMAARLQDSYATLERKVDERTRQLALANQAKSRFFAAASHDLRQPLHAMGLFVAQLRSRMGAEERRRLVDHIEAAVSAMNELFNALLDISKLDAGVLSPSIAEFPAARVLKRIETTFTPVAREKGLSFRSVPSKAWLRSDAILLERIVLNLVSNAIRYTSRGGVVLGCRRRGAHLRIEVWDTGYGIPEDQRRNIFDEFYRVQDPARDAGPGLGLGLAIVDRISRLLDHPVDLASTLGKGSRFAVTVPVAAAPPQVVEESTTIRLPIDALSGKLVFVIDDDPLVLEGMGGLFKSWGCRVMTAANTAAVGALAGNDDVPDLIISDYRLPDGRTGLDVIGQLRDAFEEPIPGFLISGDTNPEPQSAARAAGLHLLHKPVDPMALRAMVNRMLRAAEIASVH
ncbi:MAG TPA: ATP-binding protein [Xanthobacteraceae bacterium]|jgi:signal transduction histidine kinase/CheY-like chemotaxis protein